MKAPNDRNGSGGSDKKSGQVGEKYRAGFDILRVVAAVLIFSQHAFTVTGLDHYNHVFGFRIGRLGTAILFAMSGYLSASTSRSPGAWLWGRLTRLYPAFWVVLAVGFAAAAVTGRKNFDLLQMACQFAGIGFFTHSWQLVVLTTWFVSVILLMTVLIYLARRFGHGLVFGPAVLGIVAGAHAADPYLAEYYGFAMAFLIGYGLAAPAGVLLALTGGPVLGIGAWIRRRTAVTA